MVGGSGFWVPSPSAQHSPCLLCLQPQISRTLMTPLASLARRSHYDLALVTRLTDVDDLKEGAGGEYVVKSKMVLVYCTER